MAYTGVYVFGDSLVDAGNALKLAEWYGDLTFSDLPDGAPTAELGYFDGRFSNGYTFADLLANKAIGTVTEPVFPYGYEDPWLGVPVSPWSSDPSGNNLNFAYGGAQIRQGDEVVPDLDGQTDTFRDAVDGDADPNALYLITIGGNDVRNLAPSGSDPVARADGYLALDKAAEKYLTELSQLVAMGAKHFVITGVPDVGLIPKYDRDGNLVLDSAELLRSEAATDFSIYLDTLIRTEVVPALQALGATVTYVPLMDHVDASGTLVTGALNANLGTIAALHGLTEAELSTNLLQHQDLLFFDQIHPNAQANALLGAFMHSKLTGSEWVETLPLTSAEVDYRMSATIAAPGEVDRLVVALVAGTTYTIDLLGVSSLGTAGSLADPALRLLGPSGSLFGSNADSGAGFDATLTFAAATTGNYTIEMFGTGTPTGSYVLQAAVIGGAATLAGNSYTISNAATIVIEGAGGIGQDVVKASVSYALSQGSEIEVLRTTNDKGKTAINLTGNEFDQTIVGNSANNIIEGMAGADVLVGGAGKDVFVLSNAAVANPGAANIDSISDYASGDVVDVTQILSVAAGTNVVTAGYLRVTTGGLVQVDPDGGADGWVTLSSINGTGAVAVRYLSGGAVANVSVSRVADGALRSMSAANGNAVLVGAVAAAGLASEPAAAQGPPSRDEGLGLGSASMEGRELAVATSGDGPARPALTGEAREAVDDSALLSLGGTGPGGTRSAESDALSGSAVAPAAAMAGLPGGTDLPADLPAHAMVAEAVAMPSAAMAGIESAAGAKTAGEVARVIADALSGGGTAIDALLDALPGPANGPIAAAVAVEAAYGPLASAPAAFTAEALAIHVDSVVPA